jgi:protein-S-isoprenylcysteine O-methyltransferase Ste14
MSILSIWPWLIWGWFAAEAVIALAMRTRRGRGSLQDRGSQLLIWVVITIAMVGSDWVREVAPWPIFAAAAWLRPLSLAVLIVGLTIRIVAIATLGKAFSVNVAIRDQQKVQRSGLYRFVRHPSYLGMEIAFLAIGLHSRNWAVLAFILGLPTMALLYRIHVEEAALNQAFGEEYAEYSRVTKRLIPGVY